MPTAGEYKHEPAGIPCHCYVRRRINHSLCHKSCLRGRPKEQHRQPDHQPTKLKTVTFDPVLRIRSYENDLKCCDYQQWLDEAKFSNQKLAEVVSASSPSQQNSSPILHHESTLMKLNTPQQKPLLKAIGSNNENFDWSLCDRITSFFGFRKVDNADLTNCGSNAAVPIDDGGDFMDVNNNEEDDSTPFKTGLPKSIVGMTNFSECDQQPLSCENPSQEKYVEKIRDLIIGECDKCKEGCSSSPNLENDNNNIWENNAQSSSAAFTGDESPRCKIINPDFTVRNTMTYKNDDGNNVDHVFLPAAYNSRTSTMSKFHSLSKKTSTDFDTVTTASPVCLYSNIVDDERTTDKSNKCVYANSKSDNGPYKYKPVKSAMHKQIESKNLDSSLTISTFEGLTGYPSIGLKRYESESDLIIGNRYYLHSKKGLQADETTQHLRLNLNNVASNLYDIKFLNECVRAFVRSRENDDKLERDVLAKIRTMKKVEKSLNQRKSLETCEHSIWNNILRIMQIMLFWTGCAFLVVLIYSALFSRNKDEEAD